MYIHTYAHTNMQIYICTYVQPCVWAFFVDRLVNKLLFYFILYILFIYFLLFFGFFVFMNMCTYILFTFIHILCGVCIYCQLQLLLSLMLSLMLLWCFLSSIVVAMTDWYTSTLQRAEFLFLTILPMKSLFQDPKAYLQPLNL